jgi:hypothetical protein
MEIDFVGTELRELHATHLLFVFVLAVGQTDAGARFAQLQEVKKTSAAARSPRRQGFDFTVVVTHEGLPQALRLTIQMSTVFRLRDGNQKTCPIGCADVRSRQASPAGRLRTLVPAPFPLSRDGGRVDSRPRNRGSTRAAADRIKRRERALPLAAAIRRVFGQNARMGAR